ncbi:hypothetical protein [Sphingosinicella sp. BN140058]|uniref:hypothetical protein n=1 Tax=Sphingosinicella sp. BN140058 TaxID=1892855 RepID=UPI0010110090|nr:hypothetical protein [Sphingosinicella sp. BN140058]QAY80485.1 hypothetical protein ETR14_28000 [Sphingosinicella sp. BN140058]
MAYALFVFCELAGVLILWLTHRGVFSLPLAAFTTLTMLLLSFHVMVRKPDAENIRLACLTMALWLASAFAVTLAFDGRGFLVTLGAAAFALLVGAAAAFMTYDLAQRPPFVDLED